MKKSVFLILLLYVLTFFASCTKTPVKLIGEAQGTYYAITYVDKQNRNLQNELDSLFRAFDMSASVYAKQSVISKFNINDTNAVADEVFTTVFNKAQEVSSKTNGAFDITVMPLINAWGFGFTERKKVDSVLVDSLLNFVGYKKVRLKDGRLIKDDPSIMIDFNAIAQGYSCDVIGRFLESKGIENYLVDVGGEILAKGEKPDGSLWKVGIEKPSAAAESERSIQIIVPLDNKALATSGTYRKFFTEGGRKYSHTIDPSTGFPVNHSLLSVSVIADDCMTADAYATAFMVFGVEKTVEFLKTNNALDVFMIYDDHGTIKTWHSEGFDKLIND